MSTSLLLRQRQRPAGSSSTSTNQPDVARRSTLSQVLQSSGNLANLLPTGTVLAFQLLTPLFTNNGSCDAATRPLTVGLLLLLALSCLLASFTDSLVGPNGRVHYGVVTWSGMWMLQGGDHVAAADLTKYRLALIDVVHAALSLIVFVSVATRDRNVVRCLYPEAAGNQAQQLLLNVAPIGVGIVSSFLFVLFPTTRHGIGYPVAR